MAGKKKYYFLVEVSLDTVVAQAKATGSVDYAVRGGTTSDDLNWTSRLPASEGWHQNLVGKNNDRAAIMRITRR